MGALNLSWQRSVLSTEASLGEVIANLTSVAIKIALILDAQGKLLGTVSDGDIRRGLLKGLTLASSVMKIMNPKPLVAPHGLSHELIMQLMVANKIQHIPIVNERYEVLGLYIWDDMSFNLWNFSCMSSSPCFVSFWFRRMSFPDFIHASSHAKRPCFVLSCMSLIFCMCFMLSCCCFMMSGI